MIPTLKELEAVVLDAQRAGAKQCEVFTTREAITELALDGTGSGRPRRSEVHRMVVRTWLDGGRAGEAEGTPEQVGALIARAVAAAGKAAPDPYGGPVRRMESPPRGLGVADPRHEQLTDDDRLDVLRSARKAALDADARVEIGAFTYRDAEETRRYRNSHGVALELALTRYDATGALTLVADDTRLPLREHIAGRAFASIACLPYGQVLASRATALAADAPPMSGPIRVLLPPRPTGRLIAWLAELFTIDALQAGTSFVARASGEPLFHRRLHLVDDGVAHGGLRTRGFDERGVTPVPLTLIREGQVAARLLDPERARALDTRPTGHVVDGALHPTNLQLNSGARSINAWMGEQEAPVFEVDDFDDLSGIDPATGDLDLTVAGLLREKHAIHGARRRARLTGNLVTALQQVHGMVSDTDRILHVDAPGMFVDGLSVDG